MIPLAAPNPGTFLKEFLPNSPIALTYAARSPRHAEDDIGRPSCWAGVVGLAGLGVAFARPALGHPGLDEVMLLDRAG
jgi:hypothetical protein